MCGIAGLIHLDGSQVDDAILKQMTRRIAHRGPDGEDFLLAGSVGFGHRRLAIIDVSPGGAQPMPNADRTLWITYNGELYNYKELRQKLHDLGYQFRSESDTEVLLYAYQEWGDACLERFNGMFAFAILDKRQNRVFIARDRFGVKPLYYLYRPGKVLMFASEVKALLAHPEVQPKVCYEALQQYFLFQNIYTDHTLFEGIKLLPHGSSLAIDLNQATLTPNRFWDFNFTQDEEALDAETATEEVYRLFIQAVQRQLMSDVPLGSYLSGGMDSGAIVAVSALHIPRLRTFTGGFDLSSASELEMLYDERTAAELMASQFGTEHYEVVLHPGDMEYVLPRLVWHLEDLRVGQSYPNYYVAELASKFVKVVLSGGGGDELFGGYPWRYYHQSIAPDPAANYLEHYFRYWQRLMPINQQRTFFAASIWGKLCAPSYGFDVFREIMRGFNGPMETPEQMINASLYFEAKTFLQGLFIVDDKLMMAHSLEGRVPFMDNDLADFAMRISPHLKLRNILGEMPNGEHEEIKLKKRSQVPTSDGKIVLRSAFNRLIPTDIIQRVKQGFSAPDASWFRRENVSYIEKMLFSKDTHLYAYLDQAAVRKTVGEHLTGVHNNRLLIWSLLSFEWWCRLFLDNQAVS